MIAIAILLALGVYFLVAGILGPWNGEAMRSLIASCFFGCMIWVYALAVG